MKKKSYIYWLLAGVLVAAPLYPAHAQDNPEKPAKELKDKSDKGKVLKDKELKKAESDRAESGKLKDKAEKPTRPEGSEMKDKPGKPPKEGQDPQGNAYGKNKGDLQGRDFGQERARQARLLDQERADKLNRSVAEGDDRVKMAKEKIRIAKKDLEKGKAKLPKSEYEKKKARIEAAEKAVNNLEEQVQKGKELVPPPAGSESEPQAEPEKE